MTDLNKIVQELAAKAQKQEQDQKIDVLIKVMSALYEKAITYTNLIIVAV
jgi:hypothetical protein